MFVLHLILAAGSLSTLISGAPVPSLHSGVTQVTSIHLSEERRSASTYLTTFGGTGDVADGWPSIDQWVSSFDTMFNDNIPIMKTGCAQWNVPDNTDAEISDISSAIQAVGSSTGIDPRFILAIVMQESNGCVRAPTTNYGVRNPGLMQSHDGTGTCNDATVSSPCPSSSITQMIKDGTSGTAAGDGLKQCIAETGATDVSQYYKAARIYNSGSIDSTKNLGAGIATHCYASDIANRLTGWSTGPSSCDPNTVASLSGTVGSIPDPAPVSVTIATTAAPASTPTAEATVPGGAFAEVTSTPTPTPSPIAAPATVVPEPVASSAAPVAASPTPSSVITEPIAGKPADNTPSPIATPTPTPSPSPSPSTGAVGAVTPGTACTSEGLWNCIGGTSFQQCASGTWSAIQNLAAGMQCVEGQSKVFSTSAIGRKARNVNKARR